MIDYSAMLKLGLVLGCVGLAAKAHSRKRGRRLDAHASPRHRLKVARQHAQAKAETVRSAGLMMENENIHLEDWNEWMAKSPDAIAAAIQESPRDAEIIAANIFRRVFPSMPWPPPEGTLMAEKWDSIVQAVGHGTGVPVRSRFQVVS